MCRASNAAVTVIPRPPGGPATITTPRRGRVSRPTLYKFPNSGGRGTRPLRYHTARRVSSYGTRPCPPALVRGVPPVRRPGGGGSPASRTARPGLHDDELSEIRWRFPRQSSDWLGMTRSDGPDFTVIASQCSHWRGNLPVQRNQGTTPAKTATPPVTGRGNLHRLTGLRPSFPSLPDGLPQWPEIRFAIPRNLSLRLGKSLIYIVYHSLPKKARGKEICISCRARRHSCRNT